MNLNLKSIKNLLKDSKVIGNKINKSSIYVIFDAFKCYLKYGSSFNNYKSFEFYFLKDIERETYLTDKYEKNIRKKFNNMDDFNKLCDRTYFIETFKDFIIYEYFDIRKISFKDFKEYIKDKNKIIVKSIKGKSNEEVIILDKNIIKNEYNVLKIYNSIIKKEQFLITEYIPIENSFQSVCGNSKLKVTTFLDDNMITHILKIRVNDENKNAFVDEDGKVFTPFMDENGYIYSDSNNMEVMNYLIPNFNKIKDLIDKASKKVPNVRYLEWNIAITEKGFSLIDIEDRPLVFEIKASINSNKKGSLENYKKYMNI